MVKYGVYVLILVCLSCAGTPTPAPETALEQALRAVQEDAAATVPFLEKRLFLEGGIFVTATADTFEVMYDLQRAVPVGEAWAVPFTVTAPEGTAQDILLWAPRDDAAGILLGFDDTYEAVWEAYFWLFRQYDAKVTFFVEGEMSSFCLAALAEGHDVGYHTWHHLNLTKVPREVFDEETTAKVSTFRAGGVSLRAFAYPFGLSEPWMHEELLKTFPLLRGYGVTPRVYFPEDFAAGYVTSKALDTILFKEDAVFTAVVSTLLRATKFLGGVLPLTTHTIADTADWGITPKRLTYLLQEATRLRLRFYRYSDF